LRIIYYATLATAWFSNPLFHLSFGLATLFPRCDI